MKQAAVYVLPVQSMMLEPLPGSGFSVPWRGAAYVQDATSPLAAAASSLLTGSHDASGGWMTGGAGGV